MAENIMRATNFPDRKKNECTFNEVSSLLFFMSDYMTWIRKLKFANKVCRFACKFCFSMVCMQIMCKYPTTFPFKLVFRLALVQSRNAIKWEGGKGASHSPSVMNSHNQLMRGIPDTSVAYLQKFEHLHHLFIMNFESCINDKQRNCLKQSEHKIRQKIEKVTELIC